MSAIHQHLKELIELLAIEKEEDLRQYAAKMQDTSIVERRKQGVCWYPIILDDSRYTTGERLIVTISRPEKYRESHSFQSGNLVSIFTDEPESFQVNGVINKVNKDKMIITLNADEVPRWLTKGQVGVQLLFDEASYKAMNKAIVRLLKTDNPDTLRLMEILIDGKTPSFNPVYKEQVTILNDSQNAALNKALNAQEVALIHGPPGTGKTTTLIEVIAATVRDEHQVLVCAPSNTAVDLLVEKLSDIGIKVLRLGHPARVTEEMLNMTLDAQIASHPDYENLKKLRRKAEEFFGMAKKYKRSFGYAEREQRKMMYEEAHQCKDSAEQLQYYISNEVVKNAQVIACTPVASNNQAIGKLKFRTVFIDEAGQALEPAAWIPILRAQRVIFAGDHLQLPPTVKSIEAAKRGLSTTLFEKAMLHKSASTLLNTQYRMHEKIMGFSNEKFYEGHLRAHDSVANHKMFDEDIPIEFIDTAGTGFEEKLNTESRSRYNAGEAEVIQKHLDTYLAQIDTHRHKIGIISPYKAQVSLLRESMTSDHQIDINTVDGFQGQERDIIYISLVRSNEKGEIGFLADERRMNVALTRARKKLVVVGDSATISQHDFFNDMLDYFQIHGLYRSAYELIY